MLYAAKCYWPGVTETELERVAGLGGRPGARSSHADVAYLGSLLFATDELVLCLCRSPSPANVIRAAGRARIPCERVMEAVWLPPLAPGSQSGDTPALPSTPPGQEIGR
jgi:hypothetical protein